MNIWITVTFCCLCFLVGYEIGSWKEGKAVSKAVNDLSVMHYKEIQLIVNKILELRKKGGE